MSDETDTASRYRQRAKGLRDTASNKSARGIRDQLLAIADTYERLAGELEAIDATNVAIEQAAALAMPIPAIPDWGTPWRRPGRTTG